MAPSDVGSAGPATANGDSPTCGGWLSSLLCGALLAAVYLANGREIGSYDTEPTNLLALAILRGDGPWLDRFRAVLHEPDGRLSDFVIRRRGHLLSRYPLGPALVALPLELPQIIYWDATRPGWDRDPLSAWGHAKVAGKNSAAIIVALAGVVMYRVLRRVRFGAVAFLAVLAAWLGSDLWVVGSQALWQHGPAVLALNSAILLLLPSKPSRLRVLGAGVATGALVACRALDMVFALVIPVWVAAYHPRRLAWFLPVPILFGSILVAYNLEYFGALSGGQAGLEAVHPKVHDVSGPWAGNLLAGGAGTLLSPSRGLFVFSPWVAVAVATSPIAWARLRTWPLLRCLLLALVPYSVILSKYAVWWAGHTFGPRYWIDAMPLFTLLLACGLEWSIPRRRPVALLFGLTISASIAIQAIGAFCYPSSWNLSPGNVDRHHERLWDWADNEITRCLREALK
jgi:hypothetical protein